MQYGERKQRSIDRHLIEAQVAYAPRTALRQSFTRFELVKKALHGQGREDLPFEPSRRAPRPP
jgi:hypothetical protein